MFKLIRIRTSKVSDPDDPMADYEIEAVLNYTLREDDPEWSDESDNFMTQRKERLKWPSTVFSRDDFSEHIPGREEINKEPHCWLFHDLYDHGYVLNNRRVPLLECLRLGEVWVDVVIRQQYWLNLETGDWVKDISSGKASAC